MVIKDFRVRCAVRVVGMIITLFTALVLLLQLEVVIFPLLLFVALFWQVLDLLRLVDQTNRDLGRFLLSLRETGTIDKPRRTGEWRSFTQLYEVFDAYQNDLSRNLRELEKQHLFLKIITDDIAIGILIYDRSSEAIHFANRSAYKFCGTMSLRRLSDLAKHQPELLRTIRGLRPGGRASTQIKLQDEPFNLVLRANPFQIESKSFLLISLQDIDFELEEKQLKAWRELMRVLTHEMMNSLTPICSLAFSLEEILAEEDWGSDMDRTETLADLGQGLSTIKERAEGLLQFVQTYRGLSKLSKYQPRVVVVAELFEKVRLIFKAKSVAHEVDLSFRASPEDLKIEADPHLITQVLINLILNAYQALAESDHPRIWIHAGVDAYDRAFIDVKDNGPGIPVELQERIFVPFFTTKTTGSGVGLSLSQQIMKLHGGRLIVKSKPDQETLFRLRFS